MIDLIAEMFLTPEAHQSAYDWASALLAHAMLGVVLAAALGLVFGAYRGAAGAVIGYTLLWEGGQLLFASADFIDSAIDALAFSCGAVIVAAAWERRVGWVAASVILLAFTLWRGVARRKDKDSN